MKHAPTVRRLALTAAIGGTVIGGTPALASAASTCSYNTSSKSLIVEDGSGTAPLRIFRTTGGEIRIADGTSSPGFSCFVPNTPNTATVFNTDRIAVFATEANATGTVGDGYHIDQGNGPLGPGATPESDGNSELEVQINTQTAQPNLLKVIGTGGDDEVRLGKAPGAGAAVNLGFASTPVTDQDIDVSMTTPPTFVDLFGRGGNDLLTGNGNETLRNTQPYTGLTHMSGNAGNDLLIGGNGNDALLGGTGDDRYVSVDNTIDQLFENAGEGTDVATIDTVDRIFGEIEQRFVQSTVGRMKLAPAAISTRAGSSVHVALAWTHPSSWRQLRSLQLRARTADGHIVGAITIDARQARITSEGALKASSASKLAHHGKTMTADLRVRASKKLAGRSLRLEVQATDIHGHHQLEPLAGSLTVTR